MRLQPGVSTEQPKSLLTRSLTNTSQNSCKSMQTLRCFNNTNEHAWTCQVRLNICPPFAVLHQQVELLQTAVTSVADAVLQELGGWKLHTVISEHLYSSITKAASLADPNRLAVPHNWQPFTVFFPCR